MKERKVVRTYLIFSLVVFALLVTAIAWGVDGRNVPEATRELYRRYPHLRGTRPSQEEQQKQERQQKSTGAINKGLECSKKGDYDGAIRHFKDALKLDSDNKAARDNLGSALNRKANKFYQQGDWNRATEYYKEALEYTPDDKVIQGNLRRVEQRIEAERKWQAEEAAARIKRDQAKAKINKMLDALTKYFGASKTPGISRNEMSFPDSLPSDALVFVGSGEPLFSKGSKSSAPADLEFIEPGKPMIVDPRVVKGISKPDIKQKGLEFKKSETMPPLMEKDVEGVESVKTFNPFSPAAPDSKEDSLSGGKIISNSALPYGQTTLKTKEVPPPELPEEATRYRIHFLNVRVEARNSKGEWVPIENLSTLQVGTEYRVVGDGSADILLPGGQHWRVGSNKTFRLEPPKKKSTWDKIKRFFKRGSKDRHENDLPQVKVNDGVKG